MTQLQQINVYPIKSSAGISLSSSWVDEFGLSFDRRFVLATLQGQFITARTDAKICLIQANITATGFKLTAPDMPVLSIDYQQFNNRYTQVTVWKDDIKAQVCHEDYNRWFSEYLGKPCQLLHFGQLSQRHVKNSNASVAFADGYPLMLLSSASLSHLNQQAQMTFLMSQFRPNLVVDGCQPFEEDSWQHIRIGEVEFELTKPCTRCIFTTVDPRTAQRHPQKEPLRTLQSYRQNEKGDVMFGQNLVQLNQGQVKLGDTVTVLAKKSLPTIILPKATKTEASKIVKATANMTQTNADSLTLTCRDIVDETHDVKTFVFAVVGKEEISPDYIPGQHLPITLNINNQPVNACYTLSSSPTRDQHLKITVKRVENGKVSNYLHYHFNIGDELSARKPAGNFHLKTAKLNKVLLLSAGSGVTPMLSMLKAMADNKQTLQADDVVFFHSAHSEADIIAKDEVTQLQHRHGQCQVSYTLTRSAKPEWTDYQGHLNEQMLRNIPDLLQRQVFVCGPEGFRESAKALLIKLGLPDSHYHFESFGSKKSATSAPETNNKPAQKVKQKVNILFDSWDKSVKGNTKETLLEQGEAAGLILPYSCRAGMCGSCKVKLESGDVEQLAADGLTDDEQQQGYVLACSCIPQTDVVVTKP